MKLHLKLTSVLLSAVMCASMVMAPVSVIADETFAPEETQTTEATEKEETKETEKKTPKATEKTEPEETKETEPEEKKPAESNKEEPSEPATTSESKKEDVPETTVTPETGEKEETHRVPRKNAGTSIASVSITLDAPEVGAKPDLTAVFPSGANYYSAPVNLGQFRDGVVWKDITSGTYLNPDSGVFQTGHQYKVVILLSAKEGFGFSSSTIAKVNGVTASASMNSAQLQVEYDFPMLINTILSVSISLDAPAVGAKPDYTVVFPSGANYYSADNNDGYYRNNICWSDAETEDDVHPDTGVFKAGHAYKVRVYLTAKSGYTFTDSTTATLNGKTVEEISSMEKHLKLIYTFPKLGSNVGDIETVDNVNYKVTNANTDGTGTVTVTGVEVKQAAVSVPATVVINGVTYKVNRIETKAFYGDKTIKTVYIGDNVAVIDANAFYGCSNLTKVSGGKGLKTIGSSAFARCSKLKTFVITSSVLSKIGTYAFNKDSKLKTIYIKNTTKLTKSGVKKSLKGSKVKTVKVKKSKVKKYKKYFKKKNSGRSVKVKK
ncbi:MAG: leucine-rich repeat domain-containing protein [Aeriscardovia sp.]|nr:leucine-rich repeat domain-containing protein [Aeriscardovia sp.]